MSTVSLIFLILALIAVLFSAARPKEGPIYPKKDAQGRRRAIIDGEYIDYDEQERVNSCFED